MCNSSARQKVAMKQARDEKNKEKADEGFPKEQEHWNNKLGREVSISESKYYQFIIRKKIINHKKLRLAIENKNLG